MIISSDRVPPEIIHSYSQEQGRRWLNLIRDMVERGALTSAVLKKAFSIVDQIWEKDIAKHITCKRGCSHCCTIPVAITNFEAQLLASHTRRTADYSEETCLTPSENAEAPCVFLKNNECSVYEVRPFVCRAFGSFEDPKYCEEGSSDHYLTRLEIPLRPGAGTIINWVAFITMTELGKRENDLQVKDIRQFFK